MSSADGAGPHTGATYALYGLAVRSEIALPAQRADGPADVTVVLGERRPVPAEAGAGRVLAHEVFAGGRAYSVTEYAGTRLVRFWDACEFEIEDEGARVVAHAAPHLDEALLPLFVAANVLDVVLGLRGEPVLHGSAVAFSGRAVAFAGGAGAGKSTLAASLCAAGGILVTDDLIRVDLEDSPVRCHPGPVEVRLRPNVESLADAIPGATASRTADGRVAVRVAAHAIDLPALPTLAAIVLPEPVHDDGHDLSLERLTAARALLRLTAARRLGRWRDPDRRRAEFAWLTRLARTVPVYVARLRWGPPSPERLAADLLPALGVEAGSRTPP